MEGAIYPPRVYSSYSVPHQCLAVLSGTLITVSIGMQYGWTSPSLPLLIKGNSTITTNSSDGSWLVTMPLIGLLMACIIVPFQVDRIGRKICLLISSPINLVAWLTIAYANNMLLLKCARFMAGIADGVVFVTLPMYIGELADKHIRGLLFCFVEVAFKFGILIVNIIGIQFDIKTTALIASAIPIFHFATFIWMPESPYFTTLQELRKADNVLDNLTGVHNLGTEVPSTGLKSKLSKYINMFTNKTEKKAFSITLGLLLIKLCSGELIIAFYCLTIFNEANGSINGNTSTIIYFGVHVIVAPLGGILIDKIGRRPLLIISIIGSGCGLAVEGAYFYFKNETTTDLSKVGFLPLTALLLYVIIFSMGLATVHQLMMAELFPIRSKAIAVSINNIMFSVVGIGTSKLFQIVKDNYGMHVPFFIYAFCCACGLIFVIYCVPETKGKTLEQIQLDLTSGV